MGNDQTRCPYCQCFFDTKEIEQHKAGCHDRPHGRATLTRRIDLTEMADNAVIGWKQAVLIELDRMRREMPYADTLVLRLECERRPLT